MFERFSPNLVRVISFAQEEARAMAQNSVAPEHLLLGLVRLSDDDAAGILRRRGMTLPRLMQEYTTLKSSGSLETEKSVDLPLSNLSKQLLHLAYERSQAMNSSECTTQHLLLVFLKDGAIGRVLAKLGGSISAIEGEVQQISPSQPQMPDVEALKKQISTWQNRAEMARKQGNDDLVRQALEQKGKYEKLLRES